MKSIVLLGLIALILLTLVRASQPTTALTPARSAPLMFIENVGQFDDEAAFLVRGSQATIWLVEDGLWLTLLEDSGAPLVSARHGVQLKLTFADANPRPRLEPFNRLQTIMPDFHGRRAGNEGAMTPVWGGVRYVDLYPGLDLELRGENGQLLPRLVCKANCRAAPQKVRLRVEGASAEPQNGWIDEDGIHISSQSSILSPSHPITHSPPEDLAFSTYIGDLQWDQGDAVVVDAEGNAYVTGYTSSLIFPAAPGPFTGQHGIDVYVVKLKADGSQLLYAIWVNAADLFKEDYGKDIAIDESGSLYVVGETDSADFCDFFGDVPGYDTIYAGSFDAFAFKLQPDGSSVDYCTFFGDASDRDTARAVAVDESGRAVITGGTWSAGFPTTTSAYDTSHNGFRDVFALRLSADGRALEYSTFLGGTLQEEAAAIVLDDAGNASLTGWTNSTDFSTTPGAYDTTYGGNFDAFVAQLNATGDSLLYSTYLGGREEDRGAAILTAANGASYMTGHTLSDDFPTTAGAFDATHGGGDCGFAACADAFVAALNDAGSQLIYGSYLGGSDDDKGYALALAPAGGAYLTGVTHSADFPTSEDAFDTTPGGAGDAFVTHLNATGSGLVYSSYLGGSNLDEGLGLTSDGAGGVYVTGLTASDDFPTTAGAYSVARSGDHDIFVSKFGIGLEPAPTPTSSMTVTPGPSPTPTLTVTPGPSLTPSATATATLLPTATSTPSATPTAMPAPTRYWHYLPAIWRP